MPFELFRFSILGLLLLFPLRSQRPKGDRSKAAKGRPNLTLNPCVRCGRNSDMACPLTDPLEELIGALEVSGYKRCFDYIDARAARDAMSSCTNCGAGGPLRLRGREAGWDLPGLLVVRGVPALDRSLNPTSLGLACARCEFGREKG